LAFSESSSWHEKSCQFCLNSTSHNPDDRPDSALRSGQQQRHSFAPWNEIVTTMMAISPSYTSIIADFLTETRGFEAIITHKSIRAVISSIVMRRSQTFEVCETSKVCGWRDFGKRPARRS
jgi:hypothetical protein